MLDVDRARVVAYRVAAHQLDRGCAHRDQLRILDLGVQEPRPGTALTALSARLPQLPTAEGLASTWTFRGAPHLHRAADLPRLNAALWPIGDADSQARLGHSCVQLRRAEIPALQAIQDTVAAWRGIADGTVRTKGEISTVVTKVLPADYAGWCRGCGATHVLEQLLRVSGLPAGAVIADPGPPVAFRTVQKWAGPPATPVGLETLLETYLRLHGPATRADAAGYLGSTAAAIAAAWPDGLAEVRFGRRRTYLPADEIDALRTAPAPRLVRLLPPYDPYLQSRDRLTVVPEKERHKEIWRILSNPGALLVDGEVAGVWRAKLGKARLELTVSLFDGLPAGRRREVEQEAERLAQLRGASTIAVQYA